LHGQWMVDDRATRRTACRPTMLYVRQISKEP
jgi:hypothetical protein